MQPNLEGLLALHEGVDVITFTSQSTVMNFIAIAEKNGLDPRNLPNDPVFACIGPITGQAAKEAGLSDIVIAKEYTTDGLLAALKNLEVS
jgi:uroporphyrinogen-III synthase